MAFDSDITLCLQTLKFLLRPTRDLPGFLTLRNLLDMPWSRTPVVPGSPLVCGAFSQCCLRVRIIARPPHLIVNGAQLPSRSPFQALHYGLPICSSQLRGWPRDHTHVRFATVTPQRRECFHGRDWVVSHDRTGTRWLRRRSPGAHAVIVQTGGRSWKAYSARMRSFPF